MKIKKIAIKKLFGMFDHEVKLNISDGITIIHGPNGVGKTTLLRLVDSIFNKQSVELRAIPFDEISIEFDSNKTLSIRKKINEADSSKKFGKRFEFFFEYGLKTGKPLTHKTSLSISARELGYPLSIIENVIPNIERVEVNKWIENATGDLLTLDSIIQKYGNLLPSDFNKSSNSWPDWFDEAFDSVSVRFVRAQRLLLFKRDTENQRFRSSSDEERNPKVYEAVLNYSIQLKDIIRQRLAESSVLSQSLDRTFPQRLIESYREREMIPQGELIERLNKVERKRQFLISVGLYDPEKENIPMPTVDDTNIQRVLSVYVRDAEAKLSVFDELALKIDLLVKLINSRFKYKQMKIDKEVGFVFLTENGILSPTNLSSGEQHELVLTYELLFQTKKDTLVLIDEPELSLHVGWQIRFLEDLKQIINLAQISAIVATHSPQIINNRWDLTVKLGGGSDER